MDVRVFSNANGIAALVNACEARNRKCVLGLAARRDAQDSFGKDEVPKQAITMGVDSILQARRVLLLAVGSYKADIVAKAIEGAMTDEIPASLLQEHPNVSVFLDWIAAEVLSGTDK